MLKMNSKVRWRETGKRNIDDYLRARCDHKCEHCGVQFPREVLEFHHKEPFTKKFSPTVDYWRGSKVRQMVLDEADICMVLCANCHRLEHVRLKNEGSSFRHRDRRPETEEDLGCRDQRPEDRSGGDTKESNS